MNTNISRHRLALLTMLGAYPTIIFLLTVLERPLNGQPMPVKSAVLVPMMVLGLTYVVMPTLTKLFAGWLVAGQCVNDACLVAVRSSGPQPGGSVQQAN